MKNKGEFFSWFPLVLMVIFLFMLISVMIGDMRGSKFEKQFCDNLGMNYETTNVFSNNLGDFSCVKLDSNNNLIEEKIYYCKSTLFNSCYEVKQ